jgi:hypothetical protein
MKNENQDLANSVTQGIAEYHANVAIIKQVIVVSFWSISFLAFSFLVTHPINVPRDQPNQPSLMN